MASLDNGYNAIPRFVEVPGFDGTVGIWKIKALSSSDTVTVPKLYTQAIGDNISSVRVLEPSTGVTANADTITENLEHVVTLDGSAAGDDLIMVTLHQGGLNNNIKQT